MCRLPDTQELKCRKGGCGLRMVLLFVCVCVSFCLFGGECMSRVCVCVLCVCGACVCRVCVCVCVCVSCVCVCVCVSCVCVCVSCRVVSCVSCVFYVVCRVSHVCVVPDLTTTTVKTVNGPGGSAVPVFLGPSSAVFVSEKTPSRNCQNR